MDNVFTAGELIPYSGVYRITHYPPHAIEEGITLVKGSNFPKCVDCAHVSFMLVNELSNTNLFGDLEDAEVVLEARIAEIARSA
jgi:hypothetical protein